MSASSIARRIIKISFCFAVAALCCCTASGQSIYSPTGLWEFENYQATIGTDIVPLFGIENQTTFETNEINGKPANVMRFPASSSAPDRQGYKFFHGAVPNGGGKRVNQYTIVMDIRFPFINGFIAIMETNSPDDGIIIDDADFFIRGDGGIGITGIYDGES